MTISITDVTGNWSMEGGRYRQKSLLSGYAYFGSNLSDIGMEADVMVIRGFKKRAGITTNNNDTNTQGWRIAIDTDDNEIVLERYISDWTEIATYSVTLSDNEWYKLGLITLSNGTVIGLLNGEPIDWTNVTTNPGGGITITDNGTTLVDSSPVGAGVLGFYTEYSYADFDNLEVANTAGTYLITEKFIAPQYCSVTDLFNMLAITEGKIDEEILDGILSDAQAEIDSTLSSMYRVPFTDTTYYTEVPPLIQDIYKKLVKGYYYRTQYEVAISPTTGVNIEVDLQSAKELLENLKNGTLTLAASDGSTITPQLDGGASASYTDYTIIAPTTPASGIEPDLSTMSLSDMDLFVYITNDENSLTGKLYIYGADEMGESITIPMYFYQQSGTFKVPRRLLYITSIDASDLNDGTNPSIKVYGRRYN